MGIDYRATIVYGFPVVRGCLRETVTRYNEETGQPYQALIDGEATLSLKETESTISVGDIYPGDNLEHLELFESGYDEGDLFLGRKLAMVHGEMGDDVVEFNPSGLPVSADLVDVNAFGAKHEVRPKFYLIMSCG